MTVVRSPTKNSKDGWIALSAQAIGLFSLQKVILFYAIVDTEYILIDVRIPIPRPGVAVDPGLNSHYFEIRLDQLGPALLATATKDKGRIVGVGLVPATFIVDPGSATGTRCLFLLIYQKKKNKNKKKKNLNVIFSS